MWKNWRKSPFLLPLTKYLSFLQSQWITKIFHIWKLISFAFLIFAITEKMTSGYRWHRACSFRGHLTMRTSDTRTYTKSVSYIVSRPGKGYVRAWGFWEIMHPLCLKHGLRTPNEGINQRYLKNWPTNWDCDWMFGHKVKATSYLGVHIPWSEVTLWWKNLKVQYCQVEGRAKILQQHLGVLFLCRFGYTQRFFCSRFYLTPPNDITLATLLSTIFSL